MGNNAVVVIIDDDPIFLVWLSGILSTDFDVYTVNASQHLDLDAIVRLAPDVLALDILMPGQDGLWVCQELNNVKALKSVPRLFLSANCTSGKITEDDGGIDYFVYRPAFANGLNKQLKTLINNSDVTNKKLEISRFMPLNSENDQITIYRACELTS
jgi:DNA-binding response OmpR family regulator